MDVRKLRGTLFRGRHGLLQFIAAVEDVLETYQKMVVFRLTGMGRRFESSGCAGFATINEKAPTDLKCVPNLCLFDYHAPSTLTLSPNVRGSYARAGAGMLFNWNPDLDS